MIKQVTKKKLVGKQCTPEYRVGVPEAVRHHGIDGGLIYNWRKPLEAKASVSKAEQSLAAKSNGLKRQLAEQTEELAIPKNGYARREAPELKYAFMQTHRDEFCLVAMARGLGVSRSGFC